ncbi:uncharacterized protein LOC112589180 isoform X2 [Harpegnathos saltator]|nr:uncharacterized protein LOC112589180 isoform X2 [Harpegnathos saltator]
MIGDLPVFNSKGLLVQDVQSNNIIVPICEETAKFFNLRLTEESPIHDNGGPNSADMVELGEKTVSSTASWKNDNEVRCLISNLWQDHQNHFKNMKSRDVWLMISKELKNSNPEWNQKSPVQCENKWKDIKRKYKDHNGNERP